MNKRLFGAALVLAIAGLAQAQEKSPSTETTKKPKALPVKVQVVLTEFDGDKKISSMPFTLLTEADPGDYGHNPVSLRLGVRVPVSKLSKERDFEYVDVGSNLDCTVAYRDDGLFSVSLRIERSSFYAMDKSGASKDGERAPEEPHQDPDHPILRQTRTSQFLYLKDGQTAESIAATDPLNGHTFRVSVTLSVIK